MVHSSSYSLADRRFLFVGICAVHPQNRANITRRMSDQAGAECNPNRGRSLLPRGVVDLPHERRKRRAAERAC
jgi:hypothetical protein